MNYFKLAPILLFIAIATQSCVSKKDYMQLQTDNGKLQDANKDLSARYATTFQDLTVAKSKVADLQDQLVSQKANLASLQDALNKCIASGSQGNTNVSKLVDEINSSNKYIQHLVNVKNTSDSLNMVLTTNLTRSLSADESKDVDVKVLKGVVYISLSDNMLYKSGSYEISDKAASSLSKIAKIITDYSTYDVLIEGNTDNAPISKPNIRNNWDLSALRASSVVQALQNTYAVDPKRLTAGGRGEYNPIADNSTDAGKAQNRRTQIIITPKLDQFMDLIGKPPAPTK
jgi:chemotaxis protein MotB